MRKAITVQFNWVFVLIAGALILLFFGSVAMKQRSLAELSAAQDLVFKLQKKLGVSITELGKSEEMDFQGKELRITCREFSSGKVTRTLADPLFSPENIKGKTLVTLTKMFNMPFHVTNFLYITSSSVRYILVYDPNSADSVQLAGDIKKAMGDKIKAEMVKIDDVGKLEDLGHYKTKIAFVKTPNQRVNNLKKDVKAVEILDYYELGFFITKDMEEEGQSIYLPEEYNATVLGAIFAEDQEAYECSLKKALDKLSMMCYLYEERANELQIRTAALDLSCTYGPVIDVLRDIKGISSDLSENLGQSDVEELKDKANNLRVKANQLEELNIALIMASCPEVY